ncbi:putative N-acetylmannosamine-6-phosphate 2-epimerase [Corynebacterium casei]|uniref:putative N-acetylmannosamine-6-phosphate 2-epimerase n=1 Tax=Corynebacterium casei TaxID=160386 RepID=UPI002648ED88|nr:putative N-acetylmannosamine-6-phosphate 2-epimerase [Corynebacterium casei]MDN5800507.1 putative N-acetylmannosamine-6-phosphate 2-epimerase [Corynebacterium casei]MDN5923074.1 putative N-acetylmannosamine-6-phosphate 2-epimerase [Corynebacterium casei]MDN6273450.1 putative N-acetylmannosamine-6-phosphate 2-epimerase [Corynebacterium casei]MDN6286530.1 putative N-acetylmannosamine-6-phosphate 2-epimerase [Corynebacterium casei]MDN6313667.1 putative N-acetylmannosamine-6-phosphate 2-epimera
MQITFEELRPLIEGQVIVSAQAPDGHALRDTHALTAIARACVDGGSPAIRCGGYGGVEDIASISNAVDVPVFGLTKEGTTGVYITPTKESVRAVAKAGAAVVCADATFRERPDGCTVAELIEVAHEERLVFMADCATPEQAKAAADAGADIVSTTLAGYTEDRPKTDGPDFECLAQARELIGPDVFLIGEGRFASPADAQRGLNLGANAIIIGTAITDPGWITAQFKAAIQSR